MNIAFASEHLYPAGNRACRHVETLVRCFGERGHKVYVITTPVSDAQEPDGVELLRLRDMPGAKGRGRADTLMGKAIARFLKQNEVQVVFAEGLTPLSFVTVKAAERAGAKTILRVLSDAGGVVHSIGGERRMTPSALKKKVSTMLGYTDVAAASSERCEQFLREFYDGDVRVIEKCVDMSVVDSSRVVDDDIQDFRKQLNLGNSPVILYTREEMRADTILSLIPLMQEFESAEDAPVLLVVGDVDEPERARRALADAGLDSNCRIIGRADQRDLFTAYAAASIYMTPADTRASESELLEAMAMKCALVTYGPITDGYSTAKAVNSSTLELDSEDPAAAAKVLQELFADAGRLEDLRAESNEKAAAKDIGVAVDQVHGLVEELLGASLKDDSETDVAGDDSDADVPGGDAEEISGEDPEGSDGEQDAMEEQGSRGRGRRRRGGRSSRAVRLEDDRQSDAGGADGETGEPGDRDESAEEVTEEYLETTGKRLRELDPKLTLRDLLPFLRPPKDVYVMSIPTSAGQHRAGEAVAEAFKGIDQNLRVKQVNILEYISRKYSSDEVLETLETLRRSPTMFGSPFETSGPSNEEEDEGRRDEFFDKVFAAKMKALIMEKRPDQLVLTHYLPLRFLAALKEKHDLQMKICVAVTDYDYHPRWIGEGVDQYLVPTEKVRFKMVRAGIPSNLIEVVGIPVHPSFDGSVDRDPVRKSLGLKPNAPAVLLRPGGIGSTEAIIETIRQVISEGPAFSLLVLAGKNEALRDAIKELEVPSGVTVKSFGFVDNIHEIMGAADLLITRASGHTVAEAFASGLPMVLLRPVAGIEERTADWFVERGVALKVHDGVDLEWCMNDLLRNGGRSLKRMRDAASNGGRSRTGSAQLSAERVARQLY